tara:strand:- start:8435 stop:9349 length:915 start_codon:yes stop_codon:yes gene_type:complete
MATGNYGTIRPADVSVEDVEILYSYSPNRGENSSESILINLDPTQVLIPANNPNDSGEILGGMYTLKLPTNEFAAKGIYNIIIRPKQIRTTIQACGVLSSSPDIIGIVLQLNDPNISGEDKVKFENGNLVGYRVEYLSTNTNSEQKKMQNLYRVVTSNNRVLSVAENVSNASAQVASYSFDDSSDLVFCTLTPSSAPSIKPNILPYIGEPGQPIIITNTFFNPIMVEVEMVEHDDETLSYALYGNQTKSIDDGIYTIYNNDNEIYKQYVLFEIKDQFTGKPLYEVREELEKPDFTKEFDEITDV